MNANLELTSADELRRMFELTRELAAIYDGLANGNSAAEWTATQLAREAKSIVASLNGETA